MAKPAETEANRTPAHGSHQEESFNNSSSNAYNNETPASNNGGSTPATGKRTPSTTHPYQMSEAFANRHHHCERVDGLNRGIWTSHGPGGTQDRPTGPAVEMYLRCNHDDCRRIDWRTVHGLQCHIVKNHEQPKGTIGSLEKALDRYGVPVREVEEYEKEHGEGTGGTVADPKNLKIKNKNKEAINRKSTPGSYRIDPTARPAGYKPNPAGYRDSPTVPSSTPRSSSGSVIRRNYVQEESTYSDTDDSVSVQGEPRKSGPLPARFEAIRNDWQNGSGWTTGPPPRAAVDPNRQLQGDAVMKDAPQTSTWKHWSPANQTPDGFASSRTVSIPESSHTISNESVPRPPVLKSNAPTVAPTQSVVPSTQTQAMVEQVKKVEEKQEKEDSTFATPNATESQNTDTQMSGVSETQPAVENSQNAVVDREVEKQWEAAQQSQAVPTSASDQPEADREKQEKQPESTSNAEPQDTPAALEGPARGTRSALQSPIMTNKPLDPPRSAKRVSRRSSTARKLSGDSTDGQSEMGKKNDGIGDGESKDTGRERDGSTKGQDEDMDGDSITVATGTASMRREKGEAMRESLKDREAKTPPKRNANGRFTRKRTLG